MDDRFEAGDHRFQVEELREVGGERRGAAAHLVHVRGRAEQTAPLQHRRVSIHIHMLFVLLGGMG